ncbi:MAG: hypothetical protein N2447_03455 [Thermoanaerobaculum sp.]|nr:hypothetical protein [Thermoanaerobaculum sp.]
MVSTPPQVPPAQPAPAAAPQPVKKKTSPWVWVAIGCGALLLIVSLVFVAAGLFIFKKGRDFIESAGKNPAVAAAKVVAAANPDVEVVKADEEAGTITLRNKKTGEVLTMDAKDVEQGRITFSNEKGEKITVEGKGEGEKGTFRISSKGEELVFSSEVNLPAWVPIPAGVQLEGGASTRSEEGEGGAVGFHTAMSPKEVLTFYEGSLKAAGFTPVVSKFEQNGQLVGGLVHGKHADGRNIVATVTQEKGRTQVALTFSQARP